MVSSLARQAERDAQLVEETRRHPAKDHSTSRPAGPQVRVQDQQGRTLRLAPLGGDGVSVGRLPDNSVVLEGDAVSRHHLRIDWDGNVATVTDLGSTNGTFLDGRRLTGQVTERWTALNALLVGDFWLRLELPASGETELPQPMPVATRAAPSLAPSAPSRVGVVLEPETLNLTPGQPSVVRATLVNLGQIVDHFTTTVEGVPTTWVEKPDSPIQLNPGQKATVALRVVVPRVPESLAGEHPVTVRATPREDSGESGTALARWTVLPFVASELEVSPGRARTHEEANYDVKLRNEGNGPATYDLTASDEERALGYRFESSSVALEPGQTTIVNLAARKRRRLFGSAQTHSISINSAARDGTTQTASVQLVHQALIPLWVPPLLLLLLAGLGVIVFGVLSRVPTIESVSFSPQNPNPGQAVTIRWQVTNATNLEIRPLGVKVDPAAGEYTIVEGFAGPTDLSLVASNQFGQSQQAVRIATVAPKPDAPVVSVFTVEPSKLVVVAGQQGSVTLTWQTDRADQVTIEPIGAVGPTGSRSAPAPSQDTVYTLTAKNAAGQVQKSAQLTIVLAQCAPISSGVVLRRGPNLGNPQISVLADNAVLSPLDHSQDAKWIEVEVKSTGERGWIPVDSATCNLTVPELPVASVEPPPPVPSPTVPTPTVAATPTSSPKPSGGGAPTPTPPATTPVFTLASPAKGVTIRSLKPTFKWTPTNTVSGVTYGIDVEVYNGTTWDRIQGTPNNGAPRITASSVDVVIPGTYLGKAYAAHWRVHAASATAQTQGNWQDFTLNTDPAQFEGTWITDKAATAVPVGDLIRIAISTPPTPTATPTPVVTPTPVGSVPPKVIQIDPSIIGILLQPTIILQLEVVEKCNTVPAGECSWGKKNFSYSGEPFEVPYVRSGRTHTIRITLLDSDSGTKVNILDTISPVSPAVRPTTRTFVFVPRILRIVPIVPIAPIGPIIPIGP